MANVCMYCDSIVTGLQMFYMTTLDMCSTTFHYLHEFHLRVNCCFFRRWPATTYVFELQTTRRMETQFFATYLPSEKKPSEEKARVEGCKLDVVVS